MSRTVGSTHLDPARITVRELLNRHVRRVIRHTQKKAVMITYYGVDSGRVVVDKQATSP